MCSVGRGRAVAAHTHKHKHTQARSVCSCARTTLACGWNAAVAFQPSTPAVASHLRVWGRARRVASNRAYGDKHNSIKSRPSDIILRPHDTCGESATRRPESRRASARTRRRLLGFIFRPLLFSEQSTFGCARRKATFSKTRNQDSRSTEAERFADAAKNRSRKDRRRRRRRKKSKEKANRNNMCRI